MNQAPKDALLQSRAVKRYLIERCSTLEVDPVKLANHVGLSEAMIVSWFNAPEKETMLSIPREKVVEMFEILGVHVHIHLEVIPISDIRGDFKDVINNCKS